MAACSKCGTEPPANARFCHGCGAPIARADAQAEFKQVTVLFADVVHSMDIAAAVGPERLREIMTQLVTRTSAVVQRYGGTVDKFTGDGIMALFGAPVALEDHALRACLTALGIQDATQRLAAELDGDVALSLRIGLNSGEVIAGEIGSGALGYTAVGEQVGIAQRMESVAPPGGVMVSESTARLVEGVTVLGQPQQVYVKGAVDALVGRQLLSVATDDERTEVPVSTLVGRGWEVTALAAMLDRSAAETLLDRGAAGDVAEAAAAIDRVAEHRPDQQLPVRDIWLLRMRALLARSTGRSDEYARLADRYLEMAVALGFEGHIVWAEQMP
ncbi:MAG: cyclase [Mycobacterium sp.]|nr:MAG: cyclase [Mycobacterium sp.]